MENDTIRSLTDEQVLGLIDKLEERCNVNEQVVAQLLAAYMELWAALETVTNQFLTTRTDEEQKVFVQTFREFRTNLLKDIEKVSSHGLEAIDPQLAASLQSMVSGNNAPSPESGSPDLSGSPE